MNVFLPIFSATTFSLRKNTDPICKARNISDLPIFKFRHSSINRSENQDTTRSTNQVSVLQVIRKTISHHGSNQAFQVQAYHSCLRWRGRCFHHYSTCQLCPYQNSSRRLQIFSTTMVQEFSASKVHDMITTNVM